MLDEVDKADIRDDWLYQKTKENCRMCYAVSNLQFSEHYFVLITQPFILISEHYLS